jgi:predicted phosphodiesterase
MKRYVILPDVHTHWRVAEKIIDHHKNDADKVIFLGDYFDQFHDNPHIAADTAEWFHHSVNQPNRVHICGNHDVQYWFKDCNEIRCSGYDKFKSIAINDIVTSADWRKVVFFYVIDDKWVCSHGGVHPSWINPQYSEKKTVWTVPELAERLKMESQRCIRNLGRNEHHWFIQEGFGRIKESPYYGGILWCDWNREFHCLEGINQLVGHTPNPSLSWIYRTKGDSRAKTAPLGLVPKFDKDASYNLCLDSHPGLQFYALYVDGKLVIKQTKDIGQ